MAVLFPAAIAAITKTQQMRAVIALAGRAVASTAKLIAPKRTGRGARSIAPQETLGPDGWESRVSWGTSAGYMRYQNDGTKYVHPHHFLENALHARIR
jgi:HK97 gp10 family phage protein